MKKTLLIFLLLSAMVCISCEADDSLQNGFVFTVSADRQEYTITFHSPYFVDGTPGVLANYYEFASSDEEILPKSIELKSLSFCRKEDLQIQAENEMRSYQRSSTILFCEEISCENNNTLQMYAVHETESSVYRSVCLLYDTDSEFLLTCVLDCGDLETFRKIYENGAVQQIFADICITATP